MTALIPRGSIGGSARARRDLALQTFNHSRGVALQQALEQKRSSVCHSVSWNVAATCVVPPVMRQLLCGAVFQ